MIPLDLLAAALIVTGSAFAMVGGLGVLRLVDVFARMHAAAKAPTFGLMLVVLGAALRVGTAQDVVLLLLAVMLQLLTAPVGAHLVARAAYSSGDQLSPDTVIDELAGTDD